MKLRTRNGKEKEFGAGCVIGLQSETNLIVIMPDDGGGDRFRWPGGDDKRVMPRYAHGEADFVQIVLLIADLMGLVPVPVKRPYGPAFRLDEDPTNK